MRHVILIIILFIQLSFSQELDPYRLGHKVKPAFQSIHLNLNPDNDDYSGNTVIDLQIKEEISSFRLHSRDFVISKIGMKHENTMIAVGCEFQEHGLLKIKPEKTLPSGNYKLFLEFEGKLSQKGEGIVKFTKDSLDYIYTQFQAIKARKFFPCFDEPSFKFPYQISIAAPKDYLVISNTPIESETTNGAEKTILFKKTKPLPSYLLAFAVGPYETTPIPGLKIPGRIILPKGYLDKSRIAKNMTAKILTALEEYFGIPYPYEKLDFIGVSGHTGAMENPGLIVYMESFLIDAKEVPLTQKRDVAYLVSHELAHMWFGDFVTLEWWDDTWLNEGFADWISMEIMIEQFPELNPYEVLLKNFNWALRGDIKATTEPIQHIVKGDDNPEDVFDALTYAKSQIVLRMVENWIGRDSFRKGLKNYFKKYKWENATADDLITALQQVTDKPVRQVMNDFVFKAGIPLLKTEIKNANTIQITQQRYKGVENSIEYPEVWHIPLSLKIYDGETLHQKRVYLDQVKAEFTFPDIKNIEWVYLKDDLLGYFIGVVPSSFYKSAVSASHLKKFEKSDLLSGIGYSHMAGIINPVEIFDMTYELRNASDLSIVESIALRLNDIWYLYKKTVNKMDFKSYADQTAIPLLEKIGYEFSMDESDGKTWARNSLFAILQQNEDVLNKIYVHANLYLESSKELNFKHRRYLSWLFFHKGTPELYESVFNRFKNSENPDERWVLSQTIGWFKDETLVKKNLDFIFSGNLQPFQRLFLAVGIQRMYKWNNKSNQNLIPWLRENYVLFKEKVSEDLLDNWLPFFVMDYDDLAFFDDLFPKDTRSKTMQKSLEKRIEDLKKDQKLIELYGNDVKKYLIDFNKYISSE